MCTTSCHVHGDTEDYKNQNRAADCPWPQGKTYCRLWAHRACFVDKMKLIELGLPCNWLFSNNWLEKYLRLRSSKMPIDARSRMSQRRLSQLFGQLLKLLKEMLTQGNAIWNEIRIMNNVPVDKAIVGEQRDLRYVIDKNALNL